jgi:hypothetical protein
MTMRHYSELELLDEVYLPGESAVSGHVEECGACRARVERIAGELESIRGEFDARLGSKPEAFWAGQRASVRRRIERKPDQGVRQFRAWALAATLVVAVGGGWMLRDRDDGASRPANPVAPLAAPAPTPVATGVLQLPTSDPWAADELAGWEQAVAWESWLEPGDLGQEDA